jgi:uncharacterized protein
LAPILRVVLFAGIVCAVFTIAGLFLLRRVWLLVRREQSPWRKLEIVILVLASIGVLCLIDGFFYEPYHPQVTNVRIVTPKLTHGGASIRIVHISDLHAEPKERSQTRVVELIRAARPDLICFTGDAVNSLYFAGFHKFVSQLQAIAPVYGVRGNWDHPEDSAVLYSPFPNALLNGNALELTIKGQKILLGGMHADELASIASRFASDPNAFKLFLYHYPDAINAAKAAGVDLYLAGHTHGGQVRLPFYGALVTFSRYDKKYEAGLYHEGDTYMYVNRGIGMEGGRAPRVRFLDRPEVTVIDIVPQ